MSEDVPVSLPPPAPPLKLAVKPNERIALTILFEDPQVMVVEKPAGLVTQPGKGHTTDTLLNALFAHAGKLLHNLGEKRDFGLLHRLDRETSGLLLVAKHPNAYDALRADFEARRVDKDYLAMTAGVPQPAQGVVQARLKEVVVPAGPHSTVKKVLVSRQGQEAISAYKVLAGTAGGGAALVGVSIKTGRLHQIRAHMLFLDTPVLGDTLYTRAVASKLEPPPRLALHAHKLGFKNPMTGKFMRVTAPLPRDLVRYAERIGLSVEAAE